MEQNPTPPPAEPDLPPGYEWLTLRHRENYRPGILAPRNTGEQGFMRLALAIFAASWVLGALGDWFLTSRPAVGFALFSLVFGAGIAVVSRHSSIVWRGDARFYFPASVIFGVCMAFRDSDTLRGLNLWLCLFFLGLAVFQGVGGTERIRTLSGVVFGLLVAALNTAFGAPILWFREIRWKETFGETRHSQFKAAFRGALLALPLLLLFSWLFISADAGFERFISRILNLISFETIRHAFTVALIAWITAGILRRLFQGDRIPEPVPSCPTQAGSGTLEAAVVLGSLNLLFLCFVAVQIPYLFGGTAYVSATTDLTAADYARRGFFELATVAALLLAVLLVTDWLLPPENRNARRVFQWLGLPLIALLLVVVASALHRMLLYTSSFGLTELRLYTTAFMLLIAAWACWFAPTVPAGHRDRFLTGSIWIGAVAVLLLQASNPDAIIVRTNIARGEEGKPFDIRYALSLSADAAPVLLAGGENLPEEQKQELRKSQAQWTEQAGRKWQSLNLARWRAMRVAGPLR